MSIEQKPLELSGDFKYALDQIEKERRHLFVTGRAGTGKSTLLQLFRNTTHRKAVILAPTGVAALNVKGQTIHSFFGFPPRLLSKSDIKKRRNRYLYQNMEVLVIDEISMVRADMLDHIDYFLRLNRENPMPFGGVQVVFFGDLFQLPPVIASDVEASLFRGRYESPYFFSAKVFEEGFQMEMLELQKVYRQDNRRFLRLLESIRLNRVDYDDLEELNERYLPDFEPENFFITLTARNARARRINQQELDKISSPARFYQARIEGNFKATLYPTDPILCLKLEAQVMLIKNDPERRFVNGTIGRVIKMEEDAVTVAVEEIPGRRRDIVVNRMDWEILRYVQSKEDPEKIETETIGIFRQFPIKPAWAVTIHKAQGKTFDKVIIDLGKGAFEHGQSYVALSRCRSLEGIVLKEALRPRDILTDERIVTFYEHHF